MYTESGPPAPAPRAPHIALPTWSSARPLVLPAYTCHPPLSAIGGVVVLQASSPVLASRRQVALHPSSETVLPSSHSSAGAPGRASRSPEPHSGRSSSESA